MTLYFLVSQIYVYILKYIRCCPGESSGPNLIGESEVYGKTIYLSFNISFCDMQIKSYDIQVRLYR